MSFSATVIVFRDPDPDPDPTQLQNKKASQLPLSAIVIAALKLVPYTSSVREREREMLGNCEIVF